MRSRLAVVSRMICGSNAIVMWFFKTSCGCCVLRVVRRVKMRKETRETYPVGRHNVYYLRLRLLAIDVDVDVDVGVSQKLECQQVPPWCSKGIC